MKKTFPCGHRGRGRYCHRCAQEQQAKEARLLEHRLKRQARAVKLESDVIDMSRVPERIADKARHILQQLDQGMHFQALGGKRLIAAGGIVSIPVGRRYRIVCEHDRGAVMPVRLLSHEDYNKTLPGCTN